MKKQTLFTIACTCAAMVLLASGSSMPSFAAQGSIYYTCPMPEHADVMMDKPGKCPKCGMDLVAKTQQIAAKYTCPMHPDVITDKPGKCPKCGMELVPMKPDQK